MGIDRVDGGWDFDGWVEYFYVWVDWGYGSALHRKPSLQKVQNILFE